MTTGKIFETADPAIDPEGIISKYLQFESFRLVREHHIHDIKGPLQDRMKVLMWYLIDYTNHRNNKYEIPLSASQIRFLNSPLPAAGWSPAVTVALWNFVCRELPTHIRLDNPGVLREALYWWCVERAPVANLDRALVIDAQLSVLRSEEHYVGQQYPLNAFMIMYYERHADFHNLDLSRATDRAAFFFYFFMKSYDLPHLLQLIPKSSIRAALTRGDDGHLLIDTMLLKLALPSGSRIAESVALRERAERLFKRKTGSAPYTNHVIKAGNSGECLKPRGGISSTVEPGVALIGPFHQTSGLGQATRLSYGILLRCEDVAPTALPFAMDNPAPVGFATAATRTPYRHRREINLIHLNAESIPLAFAFESERVFESSYNIGYFFWELNTIPKCHYLALELLDEIWVSSEYNKEIYARVTDKPVINVGMSVESLPGHPDVNLIDYGVQPGATVFLTTFDSFSFIERKNPLAVISAFIKAFPEGTENVNLVIKTQNRTKVGDRHQVEIWRRIDRMAMLDSRVIVVNETMKYTDLLALKAACDCYVSLHRSEGWGFGMIEAMQLGKPVIVTAHGGNMDYCNSDNAFLVGYDLINVKTEEYIFVERGSMWAEPDIDEAASAMRAVVEDKDRARAKGDAARNFVGEKFSPEAIALRFADRLSYIRANVLRDRADLRAD